MEVVELNFVLQAQISKDCARFESGTPIKFKMSSAYFTGLVFSLAVTTIYCLTVPYYGGYENDYQVAPLKLRQKDKEQQQDLSKVPGVPGVDYPVYHTVPHTSFSCKNVPALPGMYANVETGCQAYHVCHDGREGEQGASFLCTNGTLFNQHEFACDWWYNVNCHEAQSLYRLNLDPAKNPYVPKPKPEDELAKYAEPQQHYQ